MTYHTTLELNKTMFLNIIFFISNLLIAVGFVLNGQVNKIANPIITSLFFIVILLLERYTPFKLKTYIRVLLILTLTSHSLIGEYFQAYYTNSYFDKILHLFGTFTFALLAYEIINVNLTIISSRPPVLIFILVFSVGISLGTFFEIIEFVLDHLLKEYNQFGLVDTDLDLIFDILGSFIAGLFVIFRGKMPFKTDM